MMDPTRGLQLGLVFCWQWLLILAALTFEPFEHLPALLAVTAALTLMVHHEKAQLPAPSSLGWSLLAGFLVLVLIKPGCMLRGGEQSRLCACKSNLKNVATGLELYAGDWAGQYPPELGYITPNYLKFLPTCPAAGKDTYSHSYRVHAEQYTVMCRGCYHHGAAIDTPNYPRYTALEGLLEHPPGGLL